MSQQKGDFDANQAPEKVHTLVPESYRTVAHEINPNPAARTTFYAQNQTNATQGSLVQFDANIEPEKIHTLIPEAYRTLANDGSYTFNLGTQRSTFFNQLDSDIKYDEKNKLWRTNKSLAAKKETDDLGKDNRDPWVYEFSSEAIRDIKYDASRASGPNDKTLFQKNSQDIATNKYMAENVHDFAKNYTTPLPVFPRRDGPPTGAEVKNWPYPQYSQTGSKSTELPLKVYAESFPRRDTPPTSAEVKNWPYPQFAQ